MWNPLYGRGRNLRLIIIMLFIILVFWHYCSPDSGGLFHSRYEAPFRTPDLPDGKKIAPQEYVVYLHKGHSLSQHMAAIGRDLKAHLRNQYTIGVNELTYSVSGVDDALLKAIRSDRMVKYVQPELMNKNGGRPNARPNAAGVVTMEEKAEVKAEKKPVEKNVEKEEPAKKDPKPVALAVDDEEDVKEQPA